MILQRGLAYFCRGNNIKICHKSCLLNEHLTTRTINLHPCKVNYSTSNYYRTRNSGKKKKEKLGLLPYQVLNENSEIINASEEYINRAKTSHEDKFQTLLNPAHHADILENQKIGRNPAPPNAKYLKVSVVGIPNAGKSTLVNQLIGSNICPYSEKVHTTRENALGILTKESTQIVFEVSACKECNALRNFGTSISPTAQSFFTHIASKLAHCLY